MGGNHGTRDLGMWVMTLVLHAYCHSHKIVESSHQVAICTCDRPVLMSVGGMDREREREREDIAIGHTSLHNLIVCVIVSLC